VVNRKVTTAVWRLPGGQRNADPPGGAVPRLSPMEAVRVVSLAPLGARDRSMAAIADATCWRDSLAPSRPQIPTDPPPSSSCSGSLSPDSGPSVNYPQQFSVASPPFTRANNRLPAASAATYDNQG
jgi:hypothetical protein